MVTFKIKLVFFFILLLNIVFESRSAFIKNRCPPLRVYNARVRIRQSGQVARITCNSHFKLVQGNEIANCIRGEWDTETPICAQTGCPIVDKIAHGVLNIAHDGAKLEVTCDLGYSIDGPSFIYCNEVLKWNEELRGCKENDQIYLACDFELSDNRFCGWKNDFSNDIDWLADKMSFSALFSSRRHVPSGSFQYFTGNYISLDAGNYGSSTSGRLISPPLLPSKTKQRCLMFSYKVTSGISSGPHILKVSFGGIPHWATTKGEGKVIIGLYKFNVTSKIAIEGKSCKAAIDNLIIADGDVCAQQPYEEEIDSCHDNCGKITNGMDCSCDWECHYNNNCCQDLKIYCPYIRPSEDIDRMYITTAVAATSTNKTNTIKTNGTVSHSTSSLKTNKSKILNDRIIETTPMNEHNVTMNNITTSIIQSSPTSSITSPPLLPITPTTPSTLILSPVKIAVTIPSTLTPNEVLKSNNASTDSSLIMHVLPMSSTHKPFMIVPNNTSVVNNSATTHRIVNKPTETTKFVLANTNITSIPTVIIASSSTAKPDVTNSTISFTNSINKSDTTVEFAITSKTNVTPPTFFTTSSTIKPVTINSIPFTEKSVNFSSTNLKTLTKSNVSINFEPSNTTLSIKLPNVRNITQNNVTTENKSTTLDNILSHTPNVVKYSNHSYVSKNKMDVVDSFHPSLNLIPSKYNTTLKDENTLSNDNNISHETIESTNRSEMKLYKPVENVKPTKVKLPNEKPELENSLQSQPTINGSKPMKKVEHEKQNEHSKLSGLFVNTFKYIAAIGVVLITFKFTLLLARWYFKKPFSDEMNDCFIETDSESVCNIELVSNK